MPSAFISASAIELVREEEIDVGELLTRASSIHRGLIVISDEQGTAIGTSKDGAEIRGVIFQDVTGLLSEDFKKEFWLPLLKRLQMVLGVTTSGRVRLDSSWGPHSEDGFTSFYIAPLAKFADLRAVCSVSTHNDLCLWTIVPRGTIDRELGLNHDDVVDPTAMKNSIRQKASAISSEVLRDDPTGAITTNLGVIPATDFIGGRTFQEWEVHLTPEQRNFAFSDVEHVQRLIGPAGSGKTLCLCLKALFETKSRIDQDKIPKVLFLTHSWALSFEVDEQIKRLDPVGSQFISVYPLLELARERIQQTFPGHTFRPVGADSAEAKDFMQEKMRSIVEEFLSTDWVTYRGSCSELFVSRMEAISERDVLVWDILNEIGSVINGSQLFTTKSDERKYVNLVRNNFMMNLSTEGDCRAVFAIYRILQNELESAGLISYDQELNDFLSFLRSNSWNLARAEEGWDLVYVDEFHKLNTQEREVLHYLTKERDQPPIRFATDLMQGPSNSRLTRPGLLDSEAVDTEEFGRIVNVTLKQVHRYTEKILDLANFIVKSTGLVFDLPEGSRVEGGSIPLVVRNGSLDAEITWTIDFINNNRRPNVAIIVVDDTQFPKWTANKSNRFLIMKGKDDARLVRSSPAKTVIARAEDVNGLQFEHVFLVGLNDHFESSSAPLYRQSFLSNLYTGVTRSCSSVTLVYNNDQGCPEVIQLATRRSICTEIVGREI